jgi:hypothetical protein
MMGYSRLQITRKYGNKMICNTQLEQQEEERILVERIESLDRDPASAKSWKDIRRTT